MMISTVSVIFIKSKNEVDNQKTIASIKRQTARNIEFVECDNATKGIELANGEVLAFAFAGDEWFPIKVEAQLFGLHNGGDVIYSNYYAKDRKGRILLKKQEDEILLSSLLIYKSSVPLISNYLNSERVPLNTFRNRADVNRMDNPLLYHKENDDIYYLSKWIKSVIKVLLRMD